MRKDWNKFWFGPISVVPLGLFRCAFGAIVFCSAVSLFPDRYLFFSDSGLLTTVAADAYNAATNPGPRLMPPSAAWHDPWLTLLFVVYMLSALCLMLGLGSRLAALLVFLGLNALTARDYPIIDSADTVLRLMAAYLILAPSGAACSLDRLGRILHGKEDGAPPRRVAWGFRLMQVQFCLTYLCSALTKFPGSFWQDGTAVYYTLHLTEFRRFPLPWIDADHLWAVNLLTYGTLGTELALATLIWVPRLRLYVLAAGALLHLGIDYSMDIPLFSFAMLSTYLLFVREADIARVLAWVRERLAFARLRVVYDGECDFCKSALLIVRFLDIFNLLTFLDYHDPAELARAHVVRFQDVEQAAIAVNERDRQFPGYYAFRAIAWRLPATWPLAPLMYVLGVPQVGARIYAWVAANRSHLPVAPRFKTGKNGKSERILNHI